MTMTLPDLAQKTYRDLYGEALSALPTYTRVWTDFNDSDPGITILQLLCYVEETLLYRLDRIPPELQLSFVRLVAGAARGEVELALQRERENHVEIQVGGRSCFILRDLARVVLLLFLFKLELDEGRRVEGAKLQVLEASKTYRLVTESDYVRAVRMMTRSIVDAEGMPVDSPWFTIPRTIARALSGSAHVEIVSLIDLSVPPQVFDKAPDDKQSQVLFANRYLREQPAPERVIWTRYIADDAANTRLELYRTLSAITRSYLEPRRLLGTPLRVDRPSYTPVEIDLEVVVAQGVDMALLLSEIPARLCAYLDPVTGGSGSGAAYGEVPNPLEVSRTVNALAGVRHVQKVNLTFGAFASFRLASGQRASRVGQSTQLRIDRPRFVGLPWIERIRVTLIEELSPDNSGNVELACNGETI